MQYYMTYAIDGRLTVAVNKDEIEAAKDAAEAEYMDADLNRMETIDARLVIIEDAEGNIVWEA